MNIGEFLRWIFIISSVIFLSMLLKLLFESRLTRKPFIISIVITVLILMGLILFIRFGASDDLRGDVGAFLIAIGILGASFLGLNLK